ncbi:MAG: penicillin-binding protein 1C, partial [Deltaproteobacteria bacterium]|nr:penicillin-binding protein 1C [Deltaproteobacteria bacterium]
WARWLEGFEAARLEKVFSKEQILECYLNQVPYAAQRRGVVQAARYYFDRDLDTLSHKEVLALAVMVRAPGRLNPHKNPGRLEKPILRLARKMRRENLIDPAGFVRLKKAPLQSRKAPFKIKTEHFVHHLYSTTPPCRLRQSSCDGRAGMARLRRFRTTLSAPLQGKIQAILDQRLRDLKAKDVHNGAVLVV